MPRWFSVTLLFMLAVLGPCGPAWAHSPFEPGSEVASEIAPAPMGSVARTDGDHLPGWALTQAPEMPRFPWSALLIVAAVVVLGWWRPRRAVALALVLLLAVFAFEDGLHSVHHGMDQAQASSCAVAAAGTHLSATPVDAIGPCDVVLPAVALSVETSLPDPLTRLASPEQGRAPPCMLV